MNKKKLVRSILHTLGMTALVVMGKAAHAGIHKSPADHREHLSFRLGNDLSVLLISDPSSDKAAAAMNIAVGSNADPATRPGLAHFLEHMLFLGTEKYPDAGAYKAFIQSHGGSMNAYTAHENTNFYFDVASDSLAPALDRFAQFFIAPLLDEKYVDRERHAVHSEYQAKLRDEQRRSHAALQQVMNPHHSYSHFSVGSAQTLQGNVRDDLVEFYQRYYSSNMMTLVVEGKESLTELRQMVEQYFSAIPNKHTPPVKVQAPLFSPDSLPARLSIKSLSEQNSLSLTFPVQGVRELWHEKPLHYISDLVGYEGQGSLLAHLKDTGLVRGLIAAPSIDLEQQATFKVSFELTEKGAHQQALVIEQFFAYVDLIRREGVKAELFDEQRRLQDALFRFQPHEDPIKEVSRLAAMMQHYPVEHVFDAPYRMDRYDPAHIRSFLDRITPDNMLITESSPRVATNRIDPWYNTGYRVEKPDAGELARWTTPLADKALNIRGSNPFVAHNLHVKAQEISDTQDRPGRPEVVFQRRGLTLWHLQDRDFATPHADTYFSIASPRANESVENAMMTALYARLLLDQLNESLYDAQQAGLNTRIYSHMRGISVRLSGYDEKQPLLLKTITAAMKNGWFSPQHFAHVKAQYRESLVNAGQEKPYNQTMREIFRLLLPQYSTEEKLAALDRIELEAVEAFIPALLLESDIRMMTHGNLTSDEAIALAQIVENSFIPAQEESPEVPMPVVKLPSNKPLTQTLDISHNDSAISVYFQSDSTDVKAHAQYNLLNEIVSSPFYTQLRTEKQLGYIVFGTPLVLGKAPGLAFTVQSPVAEPQQLQGHITEFVTSIGDTLDNLTPQQLERFKQSVIARVMKKDKNLTARSNRFWKDIDEEALEFDSHEALANAVADLSLEDLKDCYRKLAARQLVVRSYGTKHKAEPEHRAEVSKRCDSDIQRMKQRGRFFDA
jgi:insulysin